MTSIMNGRRTGWLAAVLAVALLACGCRPSTTPKETAKQVSRWRSYPRSKVGGAMGLVLEKHGKDVAAALYELKEGDGFAIEKQLAAGKYFPERKAFILPVGMVAFTTVEEWMAIKGPYFEVPVGLNPTNLIGTIKSPGLPDLPTEFLRFKE